MVRVIRARFDDIVHVDRATFPTAANDFAFIFVPAAAIDICAGPEEICPIGCASGEICLLVEMLNVTIILTSPGAAFAIRTPLLLHPEQCGTDLLFLISPQIRIMPGRVVWRNTSRSRNGVSIQTMHINVPLLPEDYAPF